MLKQILLLCFILVCRSSNGQIHPVAKESSVHFSIRNFGFKVGGTLDAPDGDMLFSPGDLSKSYFHVTIKSASVNTDNNSRDEHLRESDYFDVKNYPVISFVSDNIRATGTNGFEAIGRLTIKNKNKEIRLPFTAEKKGNGWLFTGSFTMNRRDYDVGGSSTLSNDLSVDIKVLAR
jgi:polyisoprenoid-binding protein YceI